MPKTSPAVERVCGGLVGIACAWFAFCATWGIAVAPAGGHIGSAASAASMIAEASLRWHTVYPLWEWYHVTDPGPTAVYTHHPFGVIWASALMLKVFGRHDFIVNLPASIMSALTPPLLYSTGKRVWGTVAGTATALAFVVLPITIGYSIFHSLEVMTIFGAVLAFYGCVHHQATGRTRYLVASVVGVAVSTSGDWVGYLIFAPLLAWMFFRAFVLPEWATPAVRNARYHRWWAWAVATALATFVLWMGLFEHVNRLVEWLSAGDARGGKDDMPLRTVLEARKSWIDFSFTPLAIFVGKLALPVAIVRFVWRRRDEEAFSLAMLFGAVLQYVVFRRGADVHIFWPHYFGAYYAYAVGQLVATAQSAGELVGAHTAPMRARAIASGAAMAMVVVTTLFVAPDGVRSLHIWRETGGRYDDKGTLYRSGADEIFVIHQIIAPHIRSGEVVGYHSDAGWGWEHTWALAGLIDEANAPSSRYPFWVARASGLGGDRLKALATHHHLRIYGDTVVVARGDANRPLDAYALEEHEPNLLQWMFTNNVEPVRSISPEPNPFETWEWRTHLGQPVALPTRAPATFDELRIAHNIAVEIGDAAGAERMREQIVAKLDRTREAHFAGRFELMGVAVERGVKPMIRVYFLAGGPTATDTTFYIRSQVVRKPWWSSIPPDPIVCEHAYPPSLPTKLWKDGFIYVFEAPLHHRIGAEEYWGTWSGPARTHGGDPKIDLALVR